MRSFLMGAACLFAAGCSLLPAAEKPAVAAVTPIGRDIMLSLPTPPGYPESASLFQTATGRKDDRKVAFQAALELSPQRVDVVILAPAGPRVLSISWTGAGVVEDRSLIAPDGLTGLNILGDIFVSLWPLAAVRDALPAGVTVEEAGGVRRIATDGRIVLEVSTGPDGKQQTLHNHDFGYQMTIQTEADE